MERPDMHQSRRDEINMSLIGSNVTRIRGDLIVVREYIRLDATTAKSRTLHLLQTATQIRG